MSVPQRWVSVQEQLSQSSNNPGVLPRPVPLPDKHLNVLQQEQAGPAAAGLAEGQLDFLLRGSAGVTAQTDAIHLPGTTHNTTHSVLDPWETQDCTGAET